MAENPLTFSELRKIQKQEKRQEELSDLEDNFILRVSNYLEMKKDVDNREYKSAKRVFDKIIGLRQEKIVKQAKFAVKSDKGGSSDLKLLPREKELFLEVKNIFQDFDQNVEKMVKGEESIETPDIDLEEEVDDLNASLNSLEKQVEDVDLSKELEEVKDRLAEKSALIEDIQESEDIDVEKIQTDIEEVESSVSETRELIDDLEERLDEVESDTIGELKVEIQNLEKQIEDVKEKDEQKEVEEGYKMVEIISDVPEFMGTDLESYGPFEEGEEVKIPEDNAEILVNRGNAEEIQN